MLEWEKTIKIYAQQSVGLLREFLTTLISKHLEWRVGANAETMRSMAMATVASAAQGAPEEAKSMLTELYAERLPSLLEDHSISVRQYALEALNNFGAIPPAQIRLIGYGVLQRLDDPSADIRVKAIQIIPKLAPAFSINADNRQTEQDMWKAFIRKTMDMLLLHYESPEQRLKKPIKNTIAALAKQETEIVRQSLKKAGGDGPIKVLISELSLTL